MSEVTGFLKDFRPQSLGTSAELVFRADQPASTAAGSILGTKRVRVNPDSAGAFTVDLASSASTNPTTIYWLTISWYEAGMPVPLDEKFPWPIVVPPGGGLLSNMFAKVESGRLIVKGDKGDPGTVIQQSILDAINNRIGVVESINADQSLAIAGVKARLDLVEGVNVDQSNAIDSVKTRITLVEGVNVDQSNAIDILRAKDVLHEDRLTGHDIQIGELQKVAPKVSNLALDTDGVPYFLPGATEVHVIQEPDGTPYFVTFMSASIGADGAPYFN